MTTAKFSRVNNVVKVDQNQWAEGKRYSGPECYKRGTLDTVNWGYFERFLPLFLRNFLCVTRILVILHIIGGYL